MVIVIFRSRLTGVDADEYAEMAQEMLARAKTMPGFISFKSFKAEDGERLSLVKWQDEETMKAWSQDERHRLAKQLGREKWYEHYDIDVAHLVREKHYARKAGE